MTAATATAPPRRQTRVARPALFKESDAILVTWLRIELTQQKLDPALRDGRILRPPAAASYLGLTEKALWWHRRHKSGPTFVRLGDRNAVGYRVADLDAWIIDRSVKPENSRLPGGTPKGA